METSVESLHGHCVNFYLDTITIYWNKDKQQDITQNFIERNSPRSRAIASSTNKTIKNHLQNQNWMVSEADSYIMTYIKVIKWWWEKNIMDFLATNERAISAILVLFNLNQTKQVSKCH